MADSHEVLAGLLDWINSLSVAPPVHTAEDVRDGNVIWKVLQQIDRFAFPGTLPSASAPTSPTKRTSFSSSSSPTHQQWVSHWSDLKHIYDAVSIFLLEECDQHLTGRPDLKAIAQNGSEVDTVLLLKLLVVAAINCGNRLQYLENMQNLPISTQEVLMNTAQEAGEAVEEDELPEGIEGSDDEPAYMSSPRSQRSHRDGHGGGGVDTELASEERLGKVIADNQRIAQEKRELQRHLDALMENHQKLQSRHDKTFDELGETRERLTSVLAGKTEFGANNKALENKQEAVIAALEARVRREEEEADGLRKENEVLRIKAEKVQKLQDEYDEVKTERDRLARKANAADKYKQKLEASQELEKESNALKSKIVDLQAQLRQSDSRSLSSNDLQREIDEYRRLLPSIEQERHELNEMKKRLEFEYHALEARHQDTLEQLRREGSKVEELQGRLRDWEEGIVPSTPQTPQPNGESGLKEDSEEEEEPEQEEKEEEQKQELTPAEFEDQEAKLTATLTDSEPTTESSNMVSEAELQAIMTPMHAQSATGKASAERKVSALLEKGLGRYRQLATHAQKQSTLIATLQAKIAAAEKEKEAIKEAVVVPPPAPERAPPPPDDLELRLHESLLLNENLRRELKLMTSAWYEQNSRLMQGGFAFGRSAGGGREPQSFLGKQRKIVEDVMLGGPRKR